MKHTATRITRFAVALCAMALCSFLFVDPAAGQFVEEWEKSKADGNAPSYISSGTDYHARGIAYGMVDDGTGTMVERLFVASTAGSDPINVLVVDPSDGTLLDSLDVSGVEDTFRDLNDIGVSEDGIVYACNLALGPFGNEPLKCYRWDSLTDSATKVVDGVGSTGERLGSHIKVTGAASDNSLLIHTPSVSSDTLFQLETSDNGSSFSVTKLLTPGEPDGTPNVEDAHPLPDGGYYHTWINEPAQQYNSSQEVTGQIPEGVADSLTSLQVFEAGGETFLAGTKNNYGGGTPQGGDSRVRVANITDGAGNATMYGQTPDLGDTEQIQGNGDVDVRVNEDGTATFFFLSTNNGIAAFTANEGPFAPSPPTVDGDIEGDNAYIKLAEWTQGDTGFGDHGMKALYGYQDGSTLYLAIVGEAEDNGNAFLLFADVSSQSGIASGNALPGTTDDLSPLNGYGTTDGGATHDFETDFGIRLASSDDGDTPGAFVSIADYRSLNDDDKAPETFLEGSLADGQMIADGTKVTFDDAPFEGTSIAYNDVDVLSNVTTEAAEFAIPLSALGASSGDTFQFFALYTSGSGDFLSANTLPEISGQGGSNLGSPGNVDFSSSNFPEDQHTGSNPLPVELASFEARRDGRSAILTWTTASETDNAGFAVQHAAGTDGSFEQVGWVGGAGTTTEAQTYRFVAEDLSAGTHRFRLKQQDVDGSTSLSEAVTLTVKPEGPVAVQEVAPNPVRGTSTLRFTPQESGQVTVSLYDVLGRKVTTLHEGRVSGGQSTRVTFDATDLSSGVYFLRVKGDDFTKTRRLTVVR